MTWIDPIAYWNRGWFERCEPICYDGVIQRVASKEEILTLCVGRVKQHASAHEEYQR